MIGYVLLVLAGCVAVLVGRALAHRYPPPLLDASLLTSKEQAIVSAVADAMFPRGGPIPLSGTEAGLVRYMDAYLRRAPPRSRGLIRLLLAFVEYGPWVFGPRRTRLTCLTPSERTTVLADMAVSSIYFRRLAFLSLRTILSMGYLANEEVAARIGMRSDAAPFERRLASSVDRRSPSSPPSVPPPAGLPA